MYSDDPGKSGEEENILTQLLLDFADKYEKEEFGLTQLSDEEYEIYSKSGLHKGKINLGQDAALSLD